MAQDFILRGKGILQDIEISTAVRNKLRNLKIELQGSSQALNALNAIARGANLSSRSIQGLNQSLASLPRAAQQAGTIKNIYGSITVGSQAAINASRTFADELANIGRRAFGFRLATIAINSTVNSLKDAAQFMADFDAALIDIQKTTGVTGSQLQELGTTIIGIASRFGLAAEDVADSYKSIVQAGFAAAEAQQFASKAAEGAAATTLTFAQATDLVIQIARQFGESEIDTIFDKIAVAEDKSAVSAIDLKDAFARAGETLHGMGADISEVNALIAALGERTRRGGAEVGNALKSIGTRLVSGASRRALEEIGVTVTNSLGQLKKPIQLLEDIKEKFSTLSQAQKIQIATTVAGRFQFENFLVAVDSVGRAQTILAAQTTSQGEAARRAALNNEKVSSKLNRLRDDALQAVGSLNQMVPALGGFKEAIDIVDSLVTSFDGLLIKLTALIGISKGLNFLKSKAFGSLVPTSVAASTSTTAGYLAGGQLGASALGAAPKAPGFIGKAAETIFSVSKFQAVFQQIAKGSLSTIESLKALGVVLIQNPIFKTLARFFAVFAGTVAIQKAGDLIVDSFGHIEEGAGTLRNSLQETAKSIITTGSSFGGLALAIGPLPAAIFTAAQQIIDAVGKIKKAIDIKKGLADIQVEGIKSGQGQQEIAAKQAAFYARFAENNDKLAQEYDKAANLETLSRQIKQADPQTISKIKATFDKVREDVIDEFAGTNFEIGPRLIRQRLQAGLDKAFGTPFPLDGLKQQTALFKSLGQNKELDAFIESMKDLGIPISTIQPQIDALRQKSEEATGSFEELAKSISEAAKTATPKKVNFRFTTEEFKVDDFSKQLRGVQDAVNDATVAEVIYKKNITDALELRKLQGSAEIHAAQTAVQDAQDNIARSFQGLFQTLDNEVKASFQQLNVGEAIANAINADIKEVVSGGKIKSGEAVLSQIEGIIGSFGIQTAGISHEKWKDLIKSIIDAQDSAAKLSGKFAQVGQSVREVRLDKFLKDLELETSIRLQTADSIKELSTALLDFKGKIGNTRESLLSTAAGFGNLGQKAAQGGIEPEEFLALAKAIQFSNNEIVKAKLEIRDLGRAATFTLKAFAERKKALLDEAAQLGETDKEGDKRKELFVKLRDLETEQASFVLKTRQDLIDKNRKLIEDEKRDAEDAAKKDASAQQELASAEKSVIDATQSLSAAYINLRDAQTNLREAVDDFKINLGLAAREVGIIQGKITGFDGQLNSITNIFGQIINETGLTEKKRLELIKQSNTEQLSLVQKAIDETKSIGEKVFTGGPDLGRDLTLGFAGIRQILQQFSSGGGFGKIDLNEFGNKLLSLPQQFREQISQALSFLPETASIGGASKDEIQKIIFGASVGESQQADIKSIAALTSKQVDLITNIAESSKENIIAARAGVAQALEGVKTAREQLDVAKINEDRARDNAILVRDEIAASASQISLASLSAGTQVASNVSALGNLTYTQSAQQVAQHSESVQYLSHIQSTTDSIDNTLKDAIQQILELGSIQGRAVESGPPVPTPGGEAGTESQYAGQIPNFALGKRKIGELVDAYEREKKHGPAGSHPVIANDTEIIIPTRSRGQIPNYQAGNNTLIDNTGIEKLLTELINQVKNTNTPKTPGEANKNVEPVQQITATINVNGRQEVQVTGAGNVADAVAQSVKRSLGGTLREESLAEVNKAILQIFKVLKERGLISGFGYS